MAVAFVFPGQGSQAVGMGQQVAQASREAAMVWESADRVLGEPLSERAWSGPAEELDQTVNAQPALLAGSIAALRALQAAWESAGSNTHAPVFYAGHSMGQYSAMVAAGVLDLADGLRLVRRRGQLMQESAEDGAMAAIIGLDESRMAELIAAGEEAGILTVANRNAPGQMVISGERAAVERASSAAKGLGAKRALMLPVSVAAHSPLMSHAAQEMREALQDVTFLGPAAPLLANADARPLLDADACRAELVDHLTRGVDWVRAVETMSQAGVDTFIEIGPGKVLTNLIKRILPHARAIATHDATQACGFHDPFAVPQQE